MCGRLGASHVGGVPHVGAPQATRTKRREYRPRPSCSPSAWDARCTEHGGVQIAALCCLARRGACVWRLRTLCEYGIDGNLARVLGVPVHGRHAASECHRGPAAASSSCTPQGGWGAPPLLCVVAAVQPKVVVEKRKKETPGDANECMHECIVCTGLLTEGASGQTHPFSGAAFDNLS